MHHIGRRLGADDRAAFRWVAGGGIVAARSPVLVRELGRGAITSVGRRRANSAAARSPASWNSRVTGHGQRVARTGEVFVRPGGGVINVGPEVTVRMATRDEAEREWQNPLHAGWKVVG